MERIASRPLPIHAHRADDRISLQTPTSTRARVSPRRHCAATSTGGSPSPSSHSGETYPQEDEDIDAVSLLPVEDIPLPILPQTGSKFRVFQDSINKPSEPPLPEDMASCFNATYHKTSLAETSEVKDLLTATLRPSNIDMVVRTTNNGLFSLKDPAMPNIRSRDAKLQEAEGSLVKSSYVTMKLPEELAQAHSRGDLSPQLYDVLSDRCLHSLTLNSVAVQQLDQVRRSAFKPVLPAHLKGWPRSPLPHILNYLETTSLPAKRSSRRKRTWLRLWGNLRRSHHCPLGIDIHTNDVHHTLDHQQQLRVLRTPIGHNVAKIRLLNLL